MLDPGIAVERSGVELREDADRVPAHPVRVESADEILRLEGARERRDGRLECVRDQEPLRALQLDEVAEILCVEQELFVVFDHVARVYPHQPVATREPLDDGEQLEWAERFPDHFVCTGLAGAVEFRAVAAAQDDDRDLARLVVSTQAPAEVGSADTRQTEVENNGVRRFAAEKRERLLAGCGLRHRERGSLERHAQQLEQSPARRRRAGSADH